MTRDATPARAGKLSMFAGVFTPSILTILGLILFLRTGYVVGELGLVDALLVILIANAITILTSLSLAAISTNITVKGGGIYYLIARTLGVEHGGTIGIVLFLAQSISIGFYCAGFAEVVVGLPGPLAEVPTQLIAAVAVVLLFGVAWLGADWATKFQYVVMALLVLGLASFAAGAFANWDVAVYRSNLTAPQNPLPFWIAFAIFFPAVTGFTQGVSMSGDLRDPGRAIPMGTFLAVGLSLLIYLATPVLLAGSASTGDLRGSYNVMRSVASYGPLVDAGVIAATLSSALASLLGAPRILQSLAKDRVFQLLTPFARGEGSSDNPRRALLLSGVIAMGTISLGSLNLIAGVVSMFFLVSYALINYATYVEARSASPSFRPTFRFFDHRLSGLAAIGCVGAMIVIDLASGIAAVVVMAAIYQYIRHRGAPARWTDGRRSYQLQVIRQNLFAVSEEPANARDWRPMLLVFSQDQARRARLLKVTAWLEGRSGIATVVRVIETEAKEALMHREKAVAELQQAIDESDSHAFPLVIVASDLDKAVPTVIQSVGIGPLSTNTVLVNWMRVNSSESGSLAGSRFTHNLRKAAALGCNLLVLNAEDRHWLPLEETAVEDRRIDVWWTNDKTSELALLLAYLMKQTDDWDEASIRVLAAAGPEGMDKTLAELEVVLAETRIVAEAVVVAEDSPESIVTESGAASLVFLPCIVRGGRFYHPFGGEVPEVLPHLPVTILTTAVQDVELDADPDDAIEVGPG